MTYWSHRMGKTDRVTYLTSRYYLDFLLLWQILSFHLNYGARQVGARSQIPWVSNVMRLWVLIYICLSYLAVCLSKFLLTWTFSADYSVSHFRSFTLFSLKLFFFTPASIYNVHKRVGNSLSIEMGSVSISNFPLSDLSL